MEYPWGVEAAGQRPSAGGRIIEFRARERDAACPSARDKHHAVGQECCRMGVSRGLEAGRVGEGAGRWIIEFGARESVTASPRSASDDQHPAIGEQRRRLVEPRSLKAACVLPLKGSSAARLHGRKPDRERQQQEHNRSCQKRGGCRLSYRGDELNWSSYRIIGFGLTI